MSTTPTLPRFRTDIDARKRVAYLRAEAVIDDATAARFERQLDARRRVARVIVGAATTGRTFAEVATLIGGIVILVFAAALLAG